MALWLQPRGKSLQHKSGFTPPVKANHFTMNSAHAAKHRNPPLNRAALVLFLHLLLLAGNLQAATHSDGATMLQITNSTYDAKAPELLAKIAEKYQLSSLGAVTRGTSTAQSLATMGAGSSYASGKHTFIVGGGAGLAVNGVDQSIGDVAKNLGDLGGDTLPRLGFGSQVSAVVGMNLGNLRAVRYLGPFEMSRLTILANFMSVSSDNLASGLSLSAAVAGLHAQYRMANARGSAAFRYGEILLITGFDYSRLNARYDSTTGARGLTPISVGAGTPSDPLLSWTPSGIMQITSGSGTVPIELVTNIRTLWLLSFYLGGAADLNVGRATADINLSGTLTGSTGTATAVGSGTLSTSRSASPQFASARGFFGVQVNLLPGNSTNIFSVFAQASATSVGGFAVQTGLRFAW